MFGLLYVCVNILFAYIKYYVHNTLIFAAVSYISVFTGIPQKCKFSHKCCTVLKEFESVRQRV